MSKLDLQLMLDTLSEASELEDTELGDQWASLVEAEIAYKYGSDAFKLAYEDEVLEQYNYFIKNCRIVHKKRYGGV